LASGALLLLLAVVLGIAIVFSLTQSTKDSEADATLSLDHVGFFDVDVMTSAGVQSKVLGYVSDYNELSRLNQWLRQESDLGSVSMQVRVGAELVTRVQEALDDPVVSCVFREQRIILNCVNAYDSLPKIWLALCGLMIAFY
jgi:hypothetical protein